MAIESERLGDLVDFEISETSPRSSASTIVVAGGPIARASGREKDFRRLSITLVDGNLVFLDGESESFEILDIVAQINVKEVG